MRELASDDPAVMPPVEPLLLILAAMLEQLAHLTKRVLDIARRDDVCRNLVRVWVQRSEASAYDDEAEPASMLYEYKAKIAALERKVGHKHVEFELSVIGLTGIRAQLA